MMFSFLENHFGLWTDCNVNVFFDYGFSDGMNALFYLSGEDSLELIKKEKVINPSRLASLSFRQHTSGLCFLYCGGEF